MMTVMVRRTKWGKLGFLQRTNHHSPVSKTLHFITTAPIVLLVMVLLVPEGLRFPPGYNGVILRHLAAGAAAEVLM